MKSNGYLAEFSLPEIFQFIEQGQKTGLLKIRTLPAAQTQEVQLHSIWLHQGRIVATASGLDYEGLVAAMAHRGMTSERLAYEGFQNCPLNTPIGLCLKSQGILKAEQLQLLFRIQVVGRLPSLFEIKDGQFEFDPEASLPADEMTGLSLSAAEAILIGLRNLQDWSALAEKLPDPNSALSSAIADKPQLSLESGELQVWKLANGTVTLRTIAAQLGLPIKQVQQIAFQLIVSELAEEAFMPLSAPTPAVVASTPVAANLPKPILNSSRRTDTDIDFDNKTNLSQSFLQNLVGFLRGKV